MAGIDAYRTILKFEPTSGDSLDVMIQDAVGHNGTFFFYFMILSFSLSVDGDVHKGRHGLNTCACNNKASLAIGQRRASIAGGCRRIRASCSSSQFRQRRSFAVLTLPIRHRGFTSLSEPKRLDIHLIKSVNKFMVDLTCFVFFRSLTTAPRYHNVRVRRIEERSSAAKSCPKRADFPSETARSVVKLAFFFDVEHRLIMASLHLELFR